LVYLGDGWGERTLQPEQTLESVTREGSSPLSGPPLEGFAQFSFAAQQWTHVVYQTGSRSAPPVLVLQELPGLAPGLIDFASRLRDAGHQVYVPWLFGPVNRRSPATNYLRLCISREFGYLRSGVTAPLAEWLRALVSYISNQNEGRAVAAIGMCVTGGFAIPLLLHPSVHTAVAAQPAIPVSMTFMMFGVGGTRRRSTLAVSRSDLAGARERLAGGARLLTVRCAPDRICPAEKLARLRQEFPVGLTTREYGDPDTINAAGDRPHATYTKEYRLSADDPLHYSRVAFDELVAFLREGQ
jgi:dienelactone hydrolase